MKKHLILSSVLGASGVALGALGAHALKAKISTGEINYDQLSAFDTATKYQLLHALLLFILTVFMQNNNSKWLRYSFNLIFYGVLCFSVSIYFLSTKGITGLSHLKWLGPITPVGGLLMIAGWICVFIAAIKMEKNEKQL